MCVRACTIALSLICRCLSVEMTSDRTDSRIYSGQTQPTASQLVRTDKIAGIFTYKVQYDPHSPKNMFIFYLFFNLMYKMRHLG